MSSPEELLRAMLVALRVADGCAIETGTRLPVGQSFELEADSGRFFEVVNHFPFPCHPEREATLLRLVGSPLSEWHGISCPLCDKTYTVESRASR